MEEIISIWLSPSGYSVPGTCQPSGNELNQTQWHCPTTRSLGTNHPYTHEPHHLQWHCIQIETNADSLGTSHPHANESYPPQWHCTDSCSHGASHPYAHEPYHWQWNSHTTHPREPTHQTAIGYHPRQTHRATTRPGGNSSACEPTPHQRWASSTPTTGHSGPTTPPHTQP